MKLNPNQYGVNSRLDTCVQVGILIEKLQLLFAEQTLTNVQKELSIKYASGHFMEVDVWIPKLNLGFEFQDSYHYVTTWYSHVSRLTMLKKDSEKLANAQHQGISLIVVPCWWDGSKESLEATIHFQRPDVCAANSRSPIPLNPPFGYFLYADIPSVGELMPASFPVEHKHQMSTSSWWIGEKYDGVRFCWQPKSKQIYSRGGQILSVHPKVSLSLPSLVIDGELWFGRGNFAFAYAIVRRAYENNWHLLRTMAFDIPAPKFRHKVYERRYKSLLFSIPDNHPVAVVVTRMGYEDATHLEDMVRHVVAREGEGVIVQRAASVYEHVRSPSLLKLKAVPADKEAVVVRVSALKVELQLPSGTVFAVRSTEILTSTPRVGDVVTFSYDGTWRSEIPQNPRIYRIRSDISWGEVLLNYEKERTRLRELSQLSGLKHDIAGINRMRTILVKFVRGKGLDPLSTKTWLSLSKQSLLQSQEIQPILQHFQDKYQRMLKTLLPELDLDNNSWDDVTRRRSFFEKYAKKHDFDPLVAENWYNQPRKQIMSFKGAASIIMRHNNSMSQALIDLFPNIGLVKSKLRHQYLWRDEVNRRKFFEAYARGKGFDVTDTEMWYAQTKEEIVSSQGGAGVIAYYNCSISKALTSLFPNIGLDPSKFHKSSYWHNIQNRRQFFVQYAINHGFNPYLPNNWSAESIDAITNTKGANLVLIHHKCNVSRALRELFPEISFDRTSIMDYQADPWSSVQNRRKFFESYAAENNFDPLFCENWYTQAREKIMARPGAKEVMSHHNKIVSQALYDLFPDIGFDSARFRVQKFSWKVSRNRKLFFEMFASQNKFNPLVAENWYKQSFAEIKTMKSARSVLIHHKNSISTALIDNFPNIGLVKSKFLKKTWKLCA